MKFSFRGKENKTVKKKHQSWKLLLIKTFKIKNIEQV